MFRAHLVFYLGGKKWNTLISKSEKKAPGCASMGVWQNGVRASGVSDLRAIIRFWKLKDWVREEGERQVDSRGNPGKGRF